KENEDSSIIQKEDVNEVLDAYFKQFYDKHINDIPVEWQCFEDFRRSLMYRTGLYLQEKTIMIKTFKDIQQIEYSEEDRKNLVFLNKDKNQQSILKRNIKKYKKGFKNRNARRNSRISVMSNTSYISEFLNPL